MLRRPRSGRLEARGRPLRRIGRPILRDAALRAALRMRADEGFQQVAVSYNCRQYRPFLEARASALIGQPVHVTGPIEARLLPAPSVKLRAVEIGAAGDANPMRARSLDLEFALGALLRGQVHAVEMHVTAPEFTLA